ncbi:hypothetical protein PFISCL1PPCAC_27666, partial [Pristionchus fissidentatus]
SSFSRFGTFSMGLFEPKFIFVKVTRGATFCSVVQIVASFVIACFPLHELLFKLKISEWEVGDAFLPSNLTLLVAISLAVSAILILIGNSKKRYGFFIPALTVQVVNFVLTIGTFFWIVTEEQRMKNHVDFFTCLCVALVLEYIFSVYYFKSFEYLKIFRS